MKFGALQKSCKHMVRPFGLETRSLRLVSRHHGLPTLLPAAATTRCAVRWLAYPMAVTAVSLASCVVSATHRARRGRSRPPPCAGRCRPWHHPSADVGLCLVILVTAALALRHSTHLAQLYFQHRVVTSCVMRSRCRVHMAA